MRQDLGQPRGVLRQNLEGELEHRRHAPDPALAPFVEHYWCVRWNLTADAGHPAAPERASGRRAWTLAHLRRAWRALRGQAGWTVAWIELALSLGYFDQAHFVRDFTRLVGHPPGEYARLGGPR